MAYVPWVPPTPPKPVSPQASELANKIGALIKDYRGYYPDLSDQDVRDALRAAGADRPDRERIRSRALVAAALAGVLVMGIIVAVRSLDGADAAPIMAPVIAGIAIVAAGVRLFLRRR